MHFEKNKPKYNVENKVDLSDLRADAAARIRP